MIIAVLVCGADGTQVLEQREVPDTYYKPEEIQPTEENGTFSENTESPSTAE